MGLVNVMGEPVLPLLYSYIGNPGIFQNDWVGIARKGKTGLFNLKSFKLLEPEYEWIVPFEKGDIIAIAKTTNQFYSIDQYGDIEKANSKDLGFEFLGFQERFSFDALSIAITPFYTSSRLGETFEEYEEGAGTVYTPLFLRNMDMMNDRFSGIRTPDQDEHSAVLEISEANLVVSRIVAIGSNIKAFFTKFTESGVDARGYMIEREQLVTISKYNQVISSTKLTTNIDYQFLCEGMEYQVIGDSLVEIVNFEGRFQDYINFPQYTYQQLNPDGTIDLLHSDRQFPSTQHVKINPGYFRKCLVKPNEESSTDFEEGNYNMLTFKHYSIDVLDIMRNEIFASYGYKFKSEKWINYFSKKSWYQPTFDNVDDQLTAIDKHNIEIILEVKSKMVGNEAEYVEKEAIFFAPPG